jgi:ankyrin repeat protein
MESRINVKGIRAMKDKFTSLSSAALIILTTCFLVFGGTLNARQTTSNTKPANQTPANQAKNVPRQIRYDITGACRDLRRKPIEWGVAPQVMSADERNRNMTTDFANFPNAILDLLEAGANVNAMDEAGFTALMYAAQKGRSCVVKILLDNGADPGIVGDTDAKGEAKTTALQIARERLQQQQSLAQKGANLKSRETDYQEVVDLLIAAGAVEAEHDK